MTGSDQGKETSDFERENTLIEGKPGWGWGLGHLSGLSTLSGASRAWVGTAGPGRQGRRAGRRKAATCLGLGDGVGGGRTLHAPAPSGPNACFPKLR